jgi:hypothetical protein
MRTLTVFCTRDEYARFVENNLWDHTYKGEKDGVLEIDVKLTDEEFRNFLYGVDKNVL